MKNAAAMRDSARMRHSDQVNNDRIILMGAKINQQHECGKLRTLILYVETMLLSSVQPRN